MSASTIASTVEFRPRHRLFVIFDSPEMARDARDALQRKVASTEDTWVFAGELGAVRLDLSGERHGLWGRLVRTVQNAMSSDYDYWAGLQRAVEHGHVVLGVHAADLSNADTLAHFLKGIGGRDFAYFADWGFEPLAA